MPVHVTHNDKVLNLKCSRVGYQFTCTHVASFVFVICL